MFKRVEKQNEEKPRDQSNDDLTEGKSNTILSDKFKILIVKGNEKFIEIT